jgi:hypothetical protein
MLLEEFGGNSRVSFGGTAVMVWGIEFLAAMRAGDIVVFHTDFGVAMGASSHGGFPFLGIKREELAGFNRL